MKKCNDCLEDKPLLEFHTRSDNTANEKRPRSICKDCHTISTTKKNNRTADTLEKHRRISFKAHIKKAYKMTTADYAKMYSNQEGLCSICNRWSHSTLDKAKGLFIDHCHTTGKIRSLLCHHCNAAIGHLREDEWTLQNAILYLRMHK